MTRHYVASGSLEPAEDGWWHARCNCGWEMGPFPDVEVVVDALMDHVMDEARREVIAEDNTPR